MTEAVAERKAGANGNEPADPLAEAIAYEAAIAGEAKQIRGNAEEFVPELTAEKFLELYPLLRRPIPPAFIQTVGKVEGKPYPSTGIRSVQVQVDRMNNVLTPLWWWDEAEYDEGGKLCKVTIRIGSSREKVLVTRSSWGGVERGSSQGNIRKGSYTNAAKLAFARIGVGSEVYIGATDFDPDVDADLAGQKPQEPADVGTDIAKKLVDRAWGIESAKDNLQLAASHVADKDVGDCSTKLKATAALKALTFDQATRLDDWVTEKANA